MAKGVIFTPQAASEIAASVRKVGALARTVAEMATVGAGTGSSAQELIGSEISSFNDPAYPFSFFVTGDILQLNSCSIPDVLGRKLDIKLPARIQLYNGINLLYLKFWQVYSGSDETSDHCWRLHTSTYDMRELDPQIIPLATLDVLRRVPDPTNPGLDAAPFSVSLLQAFQVPAVGGYPHFNAWTPGYFVSNIVCDSAPVIPEEKTETITPEGESESAELKFYEMANEWSMRDNPRLIIRDGHHAYERSDGTQTAAQELEIPTSIFDYYSSPAISPDDNGHREMYVDIYVCKDGTYVYVPVHPDDSVPVDKETAFEDQGKEDDVDTAIKVARFRYIQHKTAKFPRIEVPGYTQPSEFDDEQLLAAGSTDIVTYLQPRSFAVFPAKDLNDAIDEGFGDGDGGGDGSLRLEVGPPSQVDPPLTQVHEGLTNAALADCIRVVDIGGEKRLCIDFDRVFIGSVSAGKWRPLSDFFGVDGPDGATEVGLKLLKVIGYAASSGNKVGALRTKEYSDGNLYPVGAYAK